MEEEIGAGTQVVSSPLHSSDAVSPVETSSHQEPAPAESLT